MAIYQIRLEGVLTIRSGKNIEDIYPLSPLQQGILFHSLYASESGVYCVQWSCALHGNHMHVSAFRRAWRRVVDRHPVLRTAFNWKSYDEPFQVVYRQVELPWRQYDWQSLSAFDQEQQLKAFFIEDRKQGFALSNAPLMRLTLIRLAENAYQFVWTLHHLLLDGWSLSLLLKEVFQLYDAFCNGRELRLEACRPYGDYIAWLQQQDLSKGESFWRQTLKGFITPTALNVGRNHDSSVNKESDYDEQQMRLTAAATATLQAMAQRHRFSLNTLVQGAWALLLSRYSGQEDIVFGATVSGRPTDLVGAESMIGLFINTLPVRALVVPEASLLSWLHELQAQQAEARQYEYSPLVQVQGWSDVPRGLPLFETILAFENYPRYHAQQERGESLESRHVYFAPRTNYPLIVVAIPGPELGLRISYQRHRFDDATIARMLGHIRTLLEGMATNPGQRLVDLSILTQAERHQLLVEWNHTHVACPQDTCIHQLFEAQVERTPNAVAVVFEDQELTYYELNARANRLAHCLQALGVGPEVLVGLCVERSVEMVVGLLGILKAGGAYVPLEPTYPKERLVFLLEDTKASVLITQSWLVSQFPTGEVKLICLDTDWEMLDKQSKENPKSLTISKNLCYVIYTSGSTGKPKGVLTQHSSVVNFWHSLLQKISIHNCHEILQATLNAPLIFDASTKQIVLLLSGHTIHILSEEIRRDGGALLSYLQMNKINILDCTPSLIRVLIEEGLLSQDYVPQRILLGGEALDESLWKLLSHETRISFYNHYGPTECTVNTTICKIEQGATKPVIGRPIANVQVYLLDAHLQPVPVGVPGEVYIGGAGLARGYLSRPAQTTETFIPNPFSTEPGTRLYKTGDLARYLQDGNIEFLGRLDNQVKIRGYRIELGEIEATLERHPAIRQAVTLAREDTAGDRRLVAYCVPHHGFLPDMHELRSFLQTQLPDYMVPSTFVVLEALPMMPNGKVHRQALPAPDQARPSLCEAFVAPQTPTEELLAGIWASVLGIEAVGIHDNFFALGGHSLLAMRVLSRLRKTFQVEIPLRALFDTPTVASLARCVEMARQAALSLLPLPLRAVPRQEAGPLTMTQEHLWGLDRLLPGAPFSNMPYAVRLTGVLNAAALEQSFNAIIQRHAALRTTFTTVAGQPVQVIAPTLCLSIPVKDLRSLPQAERDTTAQRLARGEALYPFDLEEGPLLKVCVLQLDAQEHILLLTMHHIISDGWSKGVLLRELAVLYEAFCQSQPSPLPDLPLQYADYAHWQRQWLHSEAGQAQLAYWIQQLHDPLSTLELPTDRPRPEELSLRTARQSFQIPRELCAALTRLSRQEGTTLFMTLVAAFNTLLYSYTGQEDIRVGTLVANRQYQETEGLIGLFANLVILRTHLSGNPTLRQVLQRVRRTTLDAYAHQELPFEYLARVIVRARQLDRQSLFQAMFAMQNARQHTLELPALRLKVLETQPLEASACDLAMSVCETPQGLDGLCIYKTALFDAATITRMLADYRLILEHLIAQPELRLSTLHARRDG
jgi:amino acid adenylation domain-containing protein